MFGKRCDGVQVRDMGIIEKSISFFMPERIDADNRYTNTVPCAPIDLFIAEQKKNGIHYTYSDIFIASAVRLLHERPKINRFISNCVTYQRNDCCVSLAVKKDLTDDGEELTLKFHFKGTETLPEVKKILDDEIGKHLKRTEIDHSTVNVASKFCKLPNFLYRWVIGFVRFLDKHGMIPRWLIEATPFHTSIFVANLKSIKLGKIYHHIYNFGTTTIFATMSKEEFRVTTNRLGDIKTEKLMDIGLTLDERVCDGMYYGNTLRLWTKLLGDPNLLLERPAERQFDLSKKFDRQLKKSIEKEQRFQAKMKQKELKKQAKREKKLLKQQAKKEKASK